MVICLLAYLLTYLLTHLLTYLLTYSLTRRAIWVVVMNCSDQMTAKSMANTFSGLAQTGAWGCFDEFNRIPVEVLSVTAGQYGCVLNAIRAAKPTFIFDEEEIQLVPTVGAFITMNPGYAGRTELPENLKAVRLRLGWGEG